MKKVFPGPGFLIGLLFIGLATLFGLVMAWYAFTEQHWIAAVFAIGMGWFGYSSVQEFFGWFAVPPQNEFSFTSDSVLVGSSQFPLSELVEVYIGVLKTRKYTNFVPAGHDVTAVSKLVFHRGTVLKIRAGQGPFTTFSPFGKNLGEEDVAALIKKLTKIRELTGIVPQRSEIQDLVR